MKLADIMGNKVERKNNAIAIREDAAFEISMGSLEIDRFLIAHGNNEIATCQNLDSVEIELANLLILKLGSNPAYVPSRLIVQVIRSINERL